MTRRIITCAVLILGLTASVAFGEPGELKGRVHLLPEGGIGFPSGLFGDEFRKGGLNAENGFNIGVSLEKMMSSQFGLAADWRYISFPIGDIEGGGVDLKGHALGLTGRGYFSSGPTRPYIMGGVFFGKPKLSGSADNFLLFGRDLSGEVTIDWTFGVRFGIGMVTAISRGIGMFVAGESNIFMTNGKEAHAKLESPSRAIDATYKLMDDGTWLGIRGGLVIGLAAGQ